MQKTAKESLEIIIKRGWRRLALVLKTFKTFINCNVPNRRLQKTIPAIFFRPEVEARKFRHSMSSRDLITLRQVLSLLYVPSVFECCLLAWMYEICQTIKMPHNYFWSINLDTLLFIFNCAGWWPLFMRFKIAVSTHMKLLETTNNIWQHPYDNHCNKDNVLRKMNEHYIETQDYN